MKHTILAVAALALLAAPAAAQQKQSETFDRTVAFSRGGTLKLKNFSGDVHITGTAGNDVVIHAVRRATRERLDNIKLDVSINGSTITIDANKRAENWNEKNDNVVETDFDIQAPSATLLDLDAFSGDLHVKGMTEDVKAHTFSGDIDLDVSGATGIPDLKAETFSGDITAHVPTGGSAQVQFNTFSGDIDSAVPLTFHGRSRKNMTADLGSGSGAKLEFKTFSGDVRLK